MVPWVHGLLVSFFLSIFRGPKSWRSLEVGIFRKGAIFLGSHPMIFPDSKVANGLLVGNMCLLKSKLFLAIFGLGLPSEQLEMNGKGSQGISKFQSQMGGFIH